MRRPFRANANKITSDHGVQIPATLLNVRHLVVLVALPFRHRSRCRRNYISQDCDAGATPAAAAKT